LRCIEKGLSFAQRMEYERRCQLRLMTQANRVLIFDTDLIEGLLE